MKMTNANIARRRPTPTRPGFTFVEVLFAVVILGIGLIMIAGMLPVAIKQNADTRNDITAKVVCDSGYAYLKALIQQHPEAFPETTGDRGTTNGGNPFVPRSGSMLAKFMEDNLMNLNPSDDYTPQGSTPLTIDPVYPVDPATGLRPTRSQLGNLKAGRMMPLSYDVVTADGTRQVTLADVTAYPLAWHQLILGDRIVSSEPRFQWLAFYRRDEGSNIIKLIIVAMRQQTAEVTDRYDASRTLPNEAIGDPQGLNPRTSNGPFLVPIEVEDMLAEPDKVKFVGAPGSNAWDVDVAETGSFLIIAHSPPLNGNLNGSGDLNRPFRNNGKILRLAARRDDLDTASARVWELAPGFDLGSADAGPDEIFGTPDDVPDGSMNTAQTFADNATAPRQQGVARYPLTEPGATTPQYAAGTTTWAWIIGRGHLDPTTATGPYVGATQDLGVLVVDVPLP